MEEKKENGDLNKQVLIKDLTEESRKKKKYRFDIYMEFGLTYIGRLIFTYYSLHGLFFIYNLILQFIILFPSFLYEINSLKGRILLSFIYIIFSFGSANILVIPTYEFLSFPFLSYKNPLGHLQSFYYIYNEIPCDVKKLINEKSIITKIFTIFIFFVQIIYILGLMIGFASNNFIIRECVKFLILIILYLNYLTIVFCYFLLSAYFFFRILITPIKGKCRFSRIFIDKMNAYFEKKPIIPDINLMSYLINPFLEKNYDFSEVDEKAEKDKWYFEDCLFSLKVLIKLTNFIFSIISFQYIFSNVSDFNSFSIFIFILLFIIMSIIAIFFTFPFCYRNIKTHGICHKTEDNDCKCNFCDPKVKYIDKISHPIIIAFSRVICDFVIIIVSVALIGIYYVHQDNDNISEKINEVSPVSQHFEIKNNKLLPNICISSVHDFPLSLFLPFINDAYYYNDDHYNQNGNNDSNIYGPYYDSSLQIEGYKKLFFNNEYDIKVIGNLIKEKNTVKMIQYNVKYQNEQLTILSIKGTSYIKDIYLDAQLYLSSALMNLLTTFAILRSKESITYKLMEFSLNIPYKIFSNYLIIDDYLNLLQNAYIENEYSFFNNVVIVGHSLGGGLAKLLGKLVKKEAVSLSGPGGNAFHSLWEYKGKSENFEISVIDLVPDMDLVPRVETSGGTVYRIICKAGVLSCHGKTMSLCEVLIMCRNPNYEIYCKKLAHLSDEDIKDIYDGSELNN